jgi:hypothetical protein
MNSTRTGRVSAGITEEYQAVSDLLGTSFRGENKAYEEFVVENTGESQLNFVSRDTSSTEDITEADSNVVAVGAEKVFARVNLDRLYVVCADDGADNSFDFQGVPV